MFLRLSILAYRHCLALLAIAAAIGFFLPFLRRSYSEWDSVYMQAAHQLRTGNDIYVLENGYLYPPFMAWAAIPFTFLSSLGSRAIWYAINIACLFLTLRWAWKTSGGGPLDGPRCSVSERCIFWIGLAVGVRFAFDALAHQQTDLVVSAALMGGCLLLVRDRTVGAGTAYGIAAAIKCTPLLWVPFLAWRKSWAAAVAVVLSAVALNLLPNLTSTAPGGGWWVEEWFVRYIAPMARSQHAPGVWGSDPLQNQSIAGAAYRWIMTSPPWSAGPVQPSGGSATARVLLVKSITYATGLLLLAGAYLVMRRTAGLPELAGHQFSLVLLLMVLLSPMSSKPHYTTLLLPGFCLARAAWTRGSRSAWISVGTAAALSALSMKDLWGTAYAEAVLWLGGVSGCAVVLYLGTIRELWKHRNIGATWTEAGFSADGGSRRAA